MAVIKKDKDFEAKEFDDADELVRWVNRNKRCIDITNISYSGSRIIRQQVYYVWYKLKKKLDKGILK